MLSFLYLLKTISHFNQLNEGESNNETDTNVFTHYYSCFLDRFGGLFISTIG
jgi:hypothetical protein